MAQESYSHHVFLSYSRRDAETMHRVRDDLRAEGLIVWTDETGLEPGTPSWTKAIQQAIRVAGCMVVLLSPDAAESDWVDRETASAEELKLRIFPVLIRGEPQNAVPLRLKTHHRIDARRDLDGAIRQLVESVCKHLGVESLAAQREREAQQEPAATPPPARREAEERQQQKAAAPARQEPPRRPVPIPDLLRILPPPFEWCEIPSGRVTLERNAGTFDVPPFLMAKYPITYEQFQVFVDAPDGWKNPAWWEGLAADASHRSAPGKQYFTHAANLPRENVSWYDAVAFCRWLSAQALTPGPSPSWLIVTHISGKRAEDG